MKVKVNVNVKQLNMDGWMWALHSDKRATIRQWRERRSTANEGENGRRDDGRMGREVQSVLLALLVFNAPSSHSCTTDGKSAVGSQVV